MIRFFMKKSLYDGWDTLIAILLINALISALALGGWFLAAFVGDSPLLALAAFVIAASALGHIALAASHSFARVSAYKSFSWKTFAQDLSQSFPHGFLYSLMMALVFGVVTVSVPYYLALGGIPGYALFAVTLWLASILALSLQWFLPIRSQLEKGFVRAVRKSFIVFFDNPGLSCFLLGYSCALTLLSFVTMFSVPGLCGVVLAQNEAFRLLMHKYDWIEKHPELDYQTARKAIPWDELLVGERETLGERSLKSFFLPWKD